jgi:hypothetical protein
MRRQFVREVGRFQVGDVRDYPKMVWTEIARSAGVPLGAITRPVEDDDLERVESESALERPMARRRGR